LTQSPVLSLAAAPQFPHFAGSFVALGSWFDRGSEFSIV
jgi:hypothetical protein